MGGDLVGGDLASRRLRRRGDALLRLGGALQRQHRFDEARAIWMSGSAEIPTHVQLRHEADLATAYYPCCGVGGHGGHGKGLPRTTEVTKPCPVDHPSLDGRVYRLSRGREVWLSKAPLLSRSECSRMIDLCEAHARGERGWSTKRHTTVPTTDMEVRAVEEVRQIFNAACERSLFPFLERAYASAAGLHATADRIRVSDAFVVRYDSRAQRSLPTHQDDSHLSLTVALNGTDEYEGAARALSISARAAVGH